jgi:hypothetical protein
MTHKLKLSIEMIPSSSWQYNLRGLLKPKMWDEIRKKVYLKNSNKCVICGSGGKLNAHEVWEYDDELHIQKLKDIIPLCFLCHGVKHIGFSSINGRENLEKFVKHFMKVNKVERSIYQAHMSEETEKFNERSRYEWQLDLEKLTDYE